MTKVREQTHSDRYGVEGVKSDFKQQIIASDLIVRQAARSGHSSLSKSRFRRTKSETVRPESFANCSS